MGEIFPVNYRIMETLIIPYMQSVALTFSFEQKHWSQSVTPVRSTVPFFSPAGDNLLSVKQLFLHRCFTLKVPSSTNSIISTFPPFLLWNIDRKCFIDSSLKKIFFLKTVTTRINSWMNECWVWHGGHLVVFIRWYLHLFFHDTWQYQKPSLLWLCCCTDRIKSSFCLRMQEHQGDRGIMAYPSPSIPWDTQGTSDNMT